MDVERRRRTRRVSHSTPHHPRPRSLLARPHRTRVAGQRSPGPARSFGNDRVHFDDFTGLIRYLVRSGSDQLAIDLVADPVQPIESPVERTLGAHAFLVDTTHEILVNKLTTLIQRMELRDLVDVGALVDQGGDLDRALAEAPRKDSGFSPLTLTWLLREFPIVSMAKAADLGPAELRKLLDLRDRLVKHITSLAAPER